jgi:hypothetical protein
MLQDDSHWTANGGEKHGGKAGNLIDSLFLRCSLYTLDAMLEGRKINFDEALLGRRTSDSTERDFITLQSIRTASNQVRWQPQQTRWNKKKRCQQALFLSHSWKLHTPLDTTNGQGCSGISAGDIKKFLEAGYHTVESIAYTCGPRADLTDLDPNDRS